MRKEHDISKAQKNRYAGMPGRQATLGSDKGTISCYKSYAQGHGR